MRSAQEEAARWFARLQNVDSEDDAERARFERWLGAHPSHAPAYRQMAQTWHDLGTTGGLRAMASAAEQERAARQADRRKFVQRGVLGAAAGLAVGGVGWQWLQDQTAGHWQAAWSTGTGDTQTHRLADGSQLSLGPRSQVALDFRRGERHVALAAGIAAFRVARDEQRPFVVDSGSTRITVLGTHFVVDQLPDRLRVSVTEGQVRVARREPWLFGLAQRDVQAWLLGAGQVLDVTASGGEAQTRLRAADALAWEQGSLVFADAPLSEVATALGRYSALPLQVPAGRGGPRIAAVVQVSDIDGFLDNLPRIAPVAVERSADAIRIRPLR